MPDDSVTRSYLFVLAGGGDPAVVGTFYNDTFLPIAGPLPPGTTNLV